MSGRGAQSTTFTERMRALKEGGTVVSPLLTETHARKRSQAKLFTDPDPDRLWWVAHTGPETDHDQLRHLGFLSFHPMMADYVFLEAVEHNRYNKTRAMAPMLDIEFLRGGSNGRTYQKVREVELMEMVGATVGQITPGARIEVVDGVGTGLRGVVLEVDGEDLLCQLEGWSTTHRVETKIPWVILQSGRNIL